MPREARLAQTSSQAGSVDRARSSGSVTPLGTHIPVGVPDDQAAVVIDCDTCTMRGTGCGDCVVTVLLGGPPYGVPLNDDEQRAIDVLADAGLVPPLRMSQPPPPAAGGLRVEALDSQQIDPA